MRASRATLLAGAQLSWLLLAGGSARAANAHATWSDLWRTPDQQGQALLDAGNPAAAAGHFRDPRRRAYADLQANRYAEAASLLTPFSDVQSEYNRGNALAKANQLQPALAAYDAALKQSPADKDIRHNRDLVARALQQQQSAPKGGQKGGKSGSSGQQQQNGGGQQSGSAAQQSGAQGRQSAGQTNGSQPGGDATDRSQKQPGQSGADTARQTPDQAQRDAAEAAAFARAQQQRRQGKAGQTIAANRAGATRPGAKDAGKGAEAPGAQTPKQQPENERQLALDQWLRQIPDSPAGLLQRKFLIEHMMKQQDADADPQTGNP